MNSKYFPSFIVNTFLSWRVNKLERRDIFKVSFLKYNNLKSKMHLYNTDKNKLYHIIGAETIRKKDQIQIGAMQILFMSSFNIFNKILQ